jgi:hypothetical protein
MKNPAIEAEVKITESEKTRKEKRKGEDILRSKLTKCALFPLGGIEVILQEESNSPNGEHWISSEGSCG